MLCWSRPSVFYVLLRELRKHDCAEHEGASHRFPHGQLLVQYDESGQYGHHGLKAEDQGGDCGVHALLPHDLQRIGNAARHDPRIEDRFPCGEELREVRRLKEQHGNRAEQAADEKLDAGHFDAVHAQGEVINDQNMDGKQDGTDEDQEIPKLDGQALRNAEKIEADDGQHYADPDEQAAPSFEEQPKERDDDDIEGRNEPRLAHGCIHDADLLKTACEAEHHAAAHAADPELPPCFCIRGLDAAGGDGVQPVEQCNAGDKEQAADEGAHAGKRVGAHIVHSYALGDEGHSPNDGGEEQQKGVPELQRVHGRCDSLRRPGMQ